MRLRSASFLAAAALISGAAPPTASAAAAPTAVRRFGSAKVVSVDGPTSLTVQNRRGQRIPIRLLGVDAPRPGECGATETQAALQQVVGRKLRDLRYELLHATRRTLERDPDGRYLATLTYYRPSIFDIADVGALLVERGWARAGLPASLESVTPRHLWSVVEADDLSDALRDKQGKPLGVWARCGGRLHLPADQPVPPTAAVPWTTTDRGVTTAIGPVTLPATLTPEGTLTLSKVAAAAPDLEIVRWEGGCVGVVPSLQVMVYAWTLDRPSTRCGDVDVHSITSYGPGQASLDRGLKVGDRTGAVRAAFPLVDDLALDSDTDAIPLSGADFHAWAWQTQAEVDERGRIGWFSTYAASPAFE